MDGSISHAIFVTAFHFFAVEARRTASSMDTRCEAVKRSVIITYQGIEISEKLWRERITPFFCTDMFVKKVLIVGTWILQLLLALLSRTDRGILVSVGEHNVCLINTYLCEMFLVNSNLYLAGFGMQVNLKHPCCRQFQRCCPHCVGKGKITVVLPSKTTPTSTAIWAIHLLQRHNGPNACYCNSRMKPAKHDDMKTENETKQHAAKKIYQRNKVDGYGFEKKWKISLSPYKTVKSDLTPLYPI